MVRITMKVALQRPRKNRTTRITKIPANIRVLVRLSMESTMNSEESINGVMVTSSGRVSISSGIILFTSLATFTVLAPDCF